jgi:hypothetical protein
VWAFPSVKGPIGANTKGQPFDVTQQFEPMPEVYETFRPDEFTNFSLDTIPQACSAIQKDSAGRVVVQPDPNTRPTHPKVIHPFSYSDEGNYQTFPTTPDDYVAITSIPNGQIPLSAYRTDLADTPQTMSSTPWSGNAEFVNQGTGTNTDASIYLAQQAQESSTFTGTSAPFPGADVGSAVEGFKWHIPKVSLGSPGTPLLRGGKGAPSGSPGTPVNNSPNTFTSPSGQVFPVPVYMPPGSTAGYGVPTGSATNLPSGPPTDFLIPQTVNSIYGPNAVTPEERVKYLTTIEPSSYNYADTAVPINANLGISYNPDLPPLVRDQVATPYKGYPLYHRLDPQLIRESLPSGRLAEMPTRGGWSSRYGNFQAQPSVNPEEIYDPRFNSYGDGQRSYYDTVSGTIQYFYSDVDSFRSPLFQGNVRSSVDHVLFTDPMGKESPEYARQVGLNDTRDAVEGTWLADSTFFRENLMEAQMRKANARVWQYRYAPLRQQGANRHHVSAANA